MNAEVESETLQVAGRKPFFYTGSLQMYFHLSKSSRCVKMKPGFGMWFSGRVLGRPGALFLAY